MIEITDRELIVICGGQSCHGEGSLKGGMVNACAPEAGKRSAIKITSGGATVYCVGGGAGGLEITAPGAGTVICGIEQSLMVKATPSCSYYFSEV